MLIKKELLENVEEQYRPMLKEVSIPDFTKCVAQFSGLHIQDVKDEVIQTYLLTWAKNKYRFFLCSPLIATGSHINVLPVCVVSIFFIQRNLSLR